MKTMDRNRKLASVVALLMLLSYFCMQPVAKADVLDGEELLGKMEQIEALKNYFDDISAPVKAEYGQYSDRPYVERESASDAKIGFRIMWIIYRNGSCDGKDYTMSNDSIQMAKATMIEFERLVEEWSDNNVDIINESVIVDRKVDTSLAVLKEITPEIAKPEIEMYADADKYNCVITVSSIAAYLGVSEISSIGSQGYLTMRIVESGTDMIMRNANVAIHEFEHTLERFRDILPLLFPHIHSYWGPTEHPFGEKYPGYEKYVELADWQAENEQFEIDCRKFYKDVLQANVKYTDPKTKQLSYIGMFPSMWKFIIDYQKAPYKNFYLGLYTIQNAETGKYFMDYEKVLKIDYLVHNGLTIVGAESNKGWGHCIITPNGDGTYSFIINDGSEYRNVVSGKWNIIKLENGEVIPNI